MTRSERPRVSLSNDVLAAQCTARPWIPVPGGPAFLIGPNFFAAKSLQSFDGLRARVWSISATAAPAANLSCKNSPAASRPPRLPKSRRFSAALTALGFDTGLADGRIGSSTTLAVQNYQRKIGMTPVDGYCWRGAVGPAAPRVVNWVVSWFLNRLVNCLPIRLDEATSP